MVLFESVSEALRETNMHPREVQSILIMMTFFRCGSYRGVPIAGHLFYKEKSTWYAKDVMIDRVCLYPMSQQAQLTVLLVSACSPSFTSGCPNRLGCMYGTAYSYRPKNNLWEGRRPSSSYRRSDILGGIVACSAQQRLCKTQFMIYRWT